MRPVYLSDLDRATRAVLAAPKMNRATTARQIVAAADVADRFRKRLSKPHPRFGTGTLTSAICDLPLARARYCDTEYRACLALVLAALSHQSA